MAVKRAMPAPSPVAQAQQLILWAREQRVQIARLKVGDIELEMADLQLVEEQVASARARAEQAGTWEPPTPPDKEGIYAQFANDVGLPFGEGDAT